MIQDAIERRLDPKEAAISIGGCAFETRYKDPFPGCVIESEDPEVYPPAFNTAAHALYWRLPYDKILVCKRFAGITWDDRGNAKSFYVRVLNR
jgi:hypothetical protein